MEKAVILEKKKKYEAVAGLWEGYLRQYPGSERAAEAKRRIEEANIAWDREEYQKVLAEAWSLEKAREIERLARWAACARYLDGKQPRRKSAERHVRKWLDWFEGWEKGKEFDITVKSARIPKGSALYAAPGKQETRVHVWLNDTKGVTHGPREAWAKGLKPEYGIKLGPYRYKWGQKGFCTRQRSEQYRRTRKNDFTEGKEEDDLFVLCHANGKFSTRCSKDKEVVVYLECPEAVPPHLPSYPDK